MKKLARVHRGVGWKSRLGWRVLNTQTGSHISLVPCCFLRGQKDYGFCMNTLIFVGAHKS